MTAIAPAPRFEIGRVISRLFQVLGRNVATFLALSALLVGLPIAVIAAWPLYGASVTMTMFINGLIGFLSPLIVGASSLVAFVANVVLQGAVIHGTVSDLAGKRAGFGDCLSTGLRFILPLVGVGLVTAIAIGFGLVLFVVPGVLMALAWSVAAPVAVAERRGVFDAISRSAELTRNHRGAILGLAVINFLVLIALQAVISGPVAVFLALGRDPAAITAVQPVETLIVQTLSATLGSAGIASIYYELRFIKEGVGAAELAAVFD